MLEREKRLNEVYEYLHNNFNIHTKGDFADSIKYARAYVSSAMNGNEKYLTDKLFRNICEAFPGVFNLHYLLNGEGTLLSMSNHQSGRSETPPDEMTSNMLEMYARMIRGVDDLRIQLREQLAEVQTVRSELQQARDDFREATYRLTQALRRVNDNGNNQIGIAADDGKND